MQLRERAHQHVDALARRQLAEKQHQWTAQAGRAGSAACRRRRTRRDRPGWGPDGCGRLDPGLIELLALDVGDGQHAVGVAHDGVAPREIEDPLGEAVALDPRGGAVRREHVRHAARSQRAAASPRQVAAGVQMRDVESTCVLSQESSKPIGRNAC